MRFDTATSAISASSALLLAATTTPDVASAANFVIIQPDDMQFYEEWNPPPHLPWTSANYPGRGYPGTSTLPWINRLRNEGLTMTQAYAAAPKCGTSRYSTVTGRYASRSSHGRNVAAKNGRNATFPADASIPSTKLRDVGGVSDGQDCSVSNVAQAFKAGGYETGMVGKWHLTKNQLVTGSEGVYAGVKAEIESCGFADVEAMYPDNFDGSSVTWAAGLSHNMEYVAHKAVEFITDNAAKDWFLYVNPTVPHGPGVGEAMDIDCRITTDGDFTGHMAAEGWGVKGMDAEFGNNCTAYREDVRERAENSDSNDDLGAIWVDDAIGAIYQALDDTNQLDDTFILFQLDHGKAEKDKIWEGGVRIPQFVRYPNGIAGTPRDWSGLVSTIDIGPTMLDFAGITPSYKMDGESWKDAVDPIAGSEDDWRENRCLFFESSGDRAVRCGCDKFLLLSDSSPEASAAASGGWWNGNEALFDLCDDAKEYVVADESTSSPEAVDLSASEPQKVEDLRSLLQCHLARTDATKDPSYEMCVGDIATPSPTVTPKPTLPVANNAGIPELIDYSPWQNDIFSTTDSTVLSATVLDDDIDRVRFNLRYPDGTVLGMAAGTQDSSSGHLSTHTRAVDTSTQTGKYGFKLVIQDDSDGIDDVCFPADCNSWIEFVVADTPAEIVRHAREEISDIIMQNNPDVNLAAKFVRHGFHACVGGCDGCVDMTNPDNAGLEVPIAALEPVVAMFAHYGVTRADVWVLAALEGSFITQEENNPVNRPFAMDWIGRPNCEDLNEPADCQDNDCSQNRGPDRELPSPNLGTHDLLEFFSNEFGFTDRDTVAIMGAHSLGGLQRENSGYNGINGWVGNVRLLANGYYDTIVGSTASLATCDTSAGSAEDCVDELKDASRWEQVFIDNSEFTTPDRWEWERGNDPDHFVMINTDIALVRDLSGAMGADGEVSTCQWKCNRNNCALPACPHAPATIGVAAEYAADNGLFLQDFESAFKKMLAHGEYNTVGGCTSEPPCTAGAQARRNLRGL